MQEEKKKALEAALSQIEKHFGKGAKRAETERHWRLRQF
jgi:RecA/RadA recombinase